MKIDLEGRTALVCGADGPLLKAVAAALADNGGTVARAGAPVADPLPDLLVFGHPARLHEGPAPTLERLDGIGEAMRMRGSGRMILLVSATAAVPARRFPEASVAAGAAVLAMRTLAMRLGPSVLVNAVGVGAIGDRDGALVAGDASLLSHVPNREPGTIDDVAHAVLFLCDPTNSYMTGQLLTVDGGWSAGYGRDF